MLRPHIEQQFFGPERRKALALRMFGIDLIDRRTLIVEHRLGGLFHGIL
jgi:hypothetical protein